MPRVRSPRRGHQWAAGTSHRRRPFGSSNGAAHRSDGKLNMRRHDQLATIRTLASADEGFAPGVTFAAGIASDLTARAQRPHRPVPALDGLTALTRALRSLPLSPSLAISPRMLRHKLMVRGAKDALLKTVIE